MGINRYHNKTGKDMVSHLFGDLLIFVLVLSKIYSTPSSAAVGKFGCLFKIRAELPRASRIDSL